MDLRLKSKLCPECGGEKYSYNSSMGEKVCDTCGLVIEDRLVDFGRDWGEFADGKSSGIRRSSGGPLTYTKGDMGLTTAIGNKQERIKSNNAHKYDRLNKWQLANSVSIERNLNIALSEIKRISSIVKLTRKLEEEASMLYTLAVRKGDIRGRKIEHLAVACCYVAVRKFQFPRSLDDFANASNLDRKEIGKCYRCVVSSLGIRMMPPNACDFIAKYTCELKLSEQAHTKAVELLHDAKGSQIFSGRSPQGLASATIYITGLLFGEKRTQREIANVAGVTEVTIRNRYKELVKVLKLKSDKIK